MNNYERQIVILGHTAEPNLFCRKEDEWYLGKRRDPNLPEKLKQERAARLRAKESVDEMAARVTAHMRLGNDPIGTWSNRTY
jgi:hypothetical protein